MPAEPSSLTFPVGQVRVSRPRISELGTNVKEYDENGRFLCVAKRQKRARSSNVKQYKRRALFGAQAGSVEPSGRKVPCAGSLCSHRKAQLLLPTENGVTQRPQFGDPGLRLWQTYPLSRGGHLTPPPTIVCRALAAGRHGEAHIPFSKTKSIDSQGTIGYYGDVICGHLWALARDNHGRNEVRIFVLSGEDASGLYTPNPSRIRLPRHTSMRPARLLESVNDVRPRGAILRTQPPG